MPDNTSFARRISTESALSGSVAGAGIAWKRARISGATSHYSETEKAFNFLDRYFANGLVGGSTSLSVEHLITDCINAGLQEKQIDEVEEFCAKYGGSVSFPEFLELMFITAARWNEEDDTATFEWKKMCVGRDTGESVTAMSKALWPELFENDEGKWPECNKMLKVKWDKILKLFQDSHFFPFEITHTNAYDLVKQAAKAAEQGGRCIRTPAMQSFVAGASKFFDGDCAQTPADGATSHKQFIPCRGIKPGWGGRRQQRDPESSNEGGEGGQGSGQDSEVPLEVAVYLIFQAVREHETMKIVKGACTHCNLAVLDSHSYTRTKDNSFAHTSCMWRAFPESRRHLSSSATALSRSRAPSLRRALASHCPRYPLFEGAESVQSAIRLEKELRVFVSLGADFEDESGMLVGAIFPILRKMCHEQGVNLVEVDVRTDEREATSAAVLKQSLGEILRCQYFVSFVGTKTLSQLRHLPSSGSPTSKRPTHAAESSFPQFRDILKAYSDRSVQELEMRCAALNCKAEDRVARRVFIFERDDAWQGEDDRNKALRREIADFAVEEALGERALTYSVLTQSIASSIKSALVAALEMDLPAEPLSPLQQEDREQEKLERELLAKVVDLPTGENDLQPNATTTHGLCEQVLQGAGTTFVLTGPPGAGKSSTCAMLAKRARESREHVKFVHLHGVECSKRSKRPIFLMLRLLQSLKTSLELNVDIPRSLEDAAYTEVSHLLLIAMSAAHEKLMRINKMGVIILDAVDRLEDLDGHEGPLGFSWIKRKMPAKLNLVLSFSDVRLPWLHDWLTLNPPSHMKKFPVPVPSAQDGVEIVSRLLRRQLSDRFDGAQRKMIEDWLGEGPAEASESYPERRLPLFLNMLGEEIRKLQGDERKQRMLLGDLSSHSVCIGLMQKVLRSSATHCGDVNLFKLVAVLLCSTREGLEAPGAELERCLRHAGESCDVLKLRSVLSLLQPFLRRSGEMLVPRNRMVVTAVMQAFVKEDADGLQRRQAVLQSLRATFSDYLERPREWKVSHREAQELPFVLKEQVARCHGRLRLLDGKIKAARKTHKTDEVAALEKEQEEASKELKGTAQVLKAFLHRLDVFLRFHQQDNPRALLRFEEVMPSDDYLEPGQASKAEPVPLLDFKQFQDELGKVVYLDELKQRFETASKSPDSVEDVGEALFNYVKVANFLVHSGRGLLKGAFGALTQGIEKASEGLQHDGTRQKSVPPTTLAERRGVAVRLPLDESPPRGTDARSTVLVMLLFEKSQLFGRHRYTDDQTDANQEQCALLRQAWDLLEQVDEELRPLYSAKVFLGIGYLCQNEAARQHLESHVASTLPPFKAQDWFSLAIQTLTGMEWSEVHELGRTSSRDESGLQLVETRRLLDKTDVRKHRDGIKALADAFNAIGEVLAKDADDLTDPAERHERLLEAEHACSRSVDVGKVLKEDNAADIGRSLLSLGKLQMLLALDSIQNPHERPNEETDEHSVDWKKQALASLAGSCQFYRQGLDNKNVRRAHPLYEHARAYLRLYRAGDEEHRKLKALKHAHKWARQALKLRESCDASEMLIEQSRALVNDLEKCMQEAEARVRANHHSDPLFEGLCKSPRDAIHLQREVRVFVSSTFVDFQKERELLVKKVFPHVRQQICVPRGVSLVEIDLRTGVTSQQALDGQVLKLCLGEVLKCQYFVSMLGMRYGWCQDVEAEEDTTLKKTLDLAKKEFPQFADILDAYDDRSITELEIRAAALNVDGTDRRARRTWFHLRQEDYKQGPERDEGQNKYEKVLALRSAIIDFSNREGVNRNIDYRTPDEVASRIEADLIAALEEDLPPEDAQLSQLEREDRDQQNMAKLLLRRFHPLAGTPMKKGADSETVRSTQSLSDEVLAHAGGKTFALVGPEGSGKSSTCAWLAKEANKRQAEHHKQFVHLHMVECSEESMQPVSVMRRILQSLKNRLNLDEVVMPSTLVEMSQTLLLALSAASKKLEGLDQHGIIVVDAVDRLELDSGDGLKSAAFSWMKRPMPSRLTLVFSFGETTKWLDFLPKDDVNIKVRHVPVPAVEDGVEVVSTYLKKFSKTLDPSHMTKLKAWLELDTSIWFNDDTFFLSSHPQPERRLPLFLTELGEEIRKLGQFQNMGEQVDELLQAEKCTVLMSKVLKESAEVSGTPELFKLVCSLICLARAGLEVHGRDTELSRCLEKAEQQGLGLQDTMQVEHAVTLFWRYTRRVGCMPVRVAAKNQMVVKAVKSAFMNETEEGRSRHRRVLELLTSCFSSWTQDGERATVRETQEFPFCVQALSQNFREDRSHLLKRFLHRLDVFLLLYKRDNPQGLSRFKEMVPDDSYVVEGKVVYLDALEMSYDRASKEEIGAVLEGYVKVAEFLVSLSRLEPAHKVLKVGVDRARASYKYYKEQLSAQESTLQLLREVLIHLLTKLDELYGRNRYKPPEEEGLDVQAEQGRLLLEAHQCLQELTDMPGGGKELLQAQVLEGIGYLCLRSKEKLPDKLKNDPGRRTAEDWFIDVIRTLTKVTGDDWETFDLSATQTMRSAAWIKMLAQAHNALAEAFGQRQWGDQKVSETPEYQRALQASEKAVQLGKLLEEGNEDVGKYCVSLGKLQMVAGRWEEAIRTLKQSKKHYRSALGDSHVRVAWPYQMLAQVYYEMSQEGGRADKTTAKHSLWWALFNVERALAIRRKGYTENKNFGIEFINQSEELLKKIQVKFKAVSTQESFRRFCPTVTPPPRERKESIAETKEVRVYIASVFQDFHEERELLNTDVFPHLRALCHLRGVSLIEVDMRAGVFKEQDNYGLLVNQCLDQIDKCQYFICLLGRRYGWCRVDAEESANENEHVSTARSEELEFDSNVARAHPQHSAMLATHWGRSLLELELRAAALDVDPHQRQGRKIWFHVRDAGLGVDQRFDYEDETKRARIEALQEEMENFYKKEYPDEEARKLMSYTSAKEAAERIRHQLEDELRNDLPPEKTATEQEDERQCVLQKHLLDRFVHLECEVAERNTQAIRSEILTLTGGQTFALVGPEGAGKSSLCAHLACEAAKEPKFGFVHLHLVECSEKSNRPVLLMLRILDCLKRKLELHDIAIPSAPDEVLQTLLLALDEGDRRLEARDQLGVIVVDGVDRLEDVDELGRLAFSWMTHTMPPRISLVFSFASDSLAEREWLTSVRKGANEGSIQVRQVPIPSVADAMAIVEKRLGQQNSEALDKESSQLLREWVQTELVDDSSADCLDLATTPPQEKRLPLFLSMLGDEIQKMASDLPEILRDRCKDLMVRNLHDTAARLVQRGGNGGADRVFKLSLCLICATREGLEVHSSTTQRGLKPSERQSELQRCLNKAQQDAVLQNVDRVQVEMAIAALEPFVRKIGTPVRLQLQNRMLTRAVRTAFMGSGEEGQQMKDTVLGLLVHSFCSWNSGERGLVTARQSAELPMLLQAQQQLDAQRRADVDRCTLLRKFLHRLDVFLLLYRNDDAREFRRFKAMVPTESYVHLESLSCVYQQDLQAAVLREQQEASNQAGPAAARSQALESHVKVAKFLIYLGHKGFLEAAHQVLKQGLEFASEQHLCSAHHERVQLACALNNLYGRNRYKPDDDTTDVAQEQGRLLLAAHRGLAELQRVCKEGERSPEVQLLQAEVLQGIGYLTLWSPNKVPLELQGTERKEAEAWFIAAVRTLTKTDAEDWQQFNPTAARSRSAAWVKAMADAHNALSDAFEFRLRGAEWSAMTANEIAATAEYKQAAAASDKAAQLGMLLKESKDPDIGKYWLSLGKLQAVAAAHESAIQTLEKSKEHYQAALHDSHPRVAWPHRKLGEVYLQQAAGMEDGAARSSCLQQAKLNADRALKIWQRVYSGDFGQPLVAAASQLVAEVDKAITECA